MLNRLALRLATVRALRGRTLARDRVHDSEHSAIDEVAVDRPLPFIVVYTDDAQYNHGDRDLWSTSGNKRVGSGYQKLVIEIAMTQRMQLVGENGEPVEDAVQPATDAAMELNLDIIERQVIAALMDPQSAWAEMWRELVDHIGDHESQRGVSMRDGVRFAGRQITLSVQLAKEPPAGAPKGPRWTRFLALASEDPTLAQVVPVLEALLAGHDLPDWQIGRGAYGLTLEEARALQVAPPEGLEDASPVFGADGLSIGTEIDGDGVDAP